MKGNMNVVLHIGLRVGKISQLMKQVGSIGCLFYFFGIFCMISCVLSYLFSLLDEIC